MRALLVAGKMHAGRGLCRASSSRHIDAMTSRRTSPWLFPLALAGLAVVALLLAGAERLATRHYLAEGLTRAETALRLTVNVLDGQLKRYEALPRLLAENQDIVRLVTEPGNLTHRAAMNRWLKETN